jgi:hypothetical protein
MAPAPAAPGAAPATPGPACRGEPPPARARRAASPRPTCARIPRAPPQTAPTAALPHPRSNGPTAPARPPSVRALPTPPSSASIPGSPAAADPHASRASPALHGRATGVRPVGDGRPRPAGVVAYCTSYAAQGPRSPRSPRRGPRLEGPASQRLTATSPGGSGLPPRGHTAAALAPPGCRVVAAVRLSPHVGRYMMGRSPRCAPVPPLASSPRSSAGGHRREGRQRPSPSHDLLTGVDREDPAHSADAPAGRAAPRLPPARAAEFWVGEQRDRLGVIATSNIRLGKRRRPARSACRELARTPAE